MLELFLSVVISSCSIAMPSCSQGCYAPPPDPTLMRCVKECKERGEVIRCVTPQGSNGVCAP